MAYIRPLDLEVFFVVWETSRFSMSYRRPLGLICRIGDLQVFHIAEKKTSRSSMSCKRRTGRQCHICDLQVHYVALDSSRSSMSHRIAPCPLCRIEDLQIFYHIKYLLVFNAAQKTSWSAIYHGRLLGLLFHIYRIEELQRRPTGLLYRIE